MIRLLLFAIAITSLFLSGCTAGMQKQSVNKRVMETGYEENHLNGSLVDKTFPNVWSVYKDFPRAEIAFTGIKEIKPRPNRFSQDFYNDEIFVWHDSGQVDRAYVSRDEFRELKKKIYSHLLKYPLVKGERFELYVLKSFDFDEFQVSGTVAENVQFTINDIKKRGGVIKAFFGHADEIGSEAYNIPLSSERAQTINQMFVQNGLAVEPLPTIGLGETTHYGDHADCRNVVVVALTKKK